MVYVEDIIETVKSLAEDYVQKYGTSPRVSLTRPEYKAYESAIASGIPRPTMVIDGEVKEVHVGRMYK